MTRGLSEPIFCLVTDGRRTLREPGNVDELVKLVGDAAAAGVNLVQVRERNLDDRQLLALTRSIVHAVEGTAARVVVNDRVDIALAGGADGVHLRGDSPPAGSVRAMVPGGFLIGRSVHSEAEAITAAGTGVDYLILGTVLSSASKPAGTAWLGLEALKRAAGGIQVPLLAIGGITAADVGGLAAAGAAGFAAIGLFAGVRNETAGERRRELQTLMAAVRTAFREGTALR
jgi:thiamine-phosphate pyrophosphorylase